MKQAIWKVDPFGDFAFHGTKSPQQTLGLSTADFKPLMVALSGEFQSKGFVSIEQVSDFVSSDRTDYHSGHVKTNTLVPMEEEGTIEVDETTRQSKRRYPPGTKIRFL